VKVLLLCAECGLSVKKLHTNRNKQRQKQLIADVVALKKSAADQVFVFFGEAKRRYQCFLVNLSFLHQLRITPNNS